MTDLPVDHRPGPTADLPVDAPTPATELFGLVIDWGGVLTGSLDGAMSDWARRDGVDFEAFRSVMRQWVGRNPGRDGDARDPGRDAPVPDSRDRASRPAPESTPEPTPVADLEQAPDIGPAAASPVHRLERGEISEADFERELAAELAARGAHVPQEGLLARLLAGLTELDPRMLDLLRRARAAGLRVALLSNSWGDHYPDRLWQGIFHAIVISGKVGMRKPEPEIFHYAAQQLGLPTQRCVMVDDLPHNISAAVGVGMVGVLHRTYDDTVEELEVLFGVPLR